MSKLIGTVTAAATLAATALIAFPAEAAVGGAPAAPKGLTVARDAANPHDLSIAWKPVPGVANYMVRVNDGGKDTNLIIPADQTSTVFHGQGACTTYRVAVSAVADKDTMATTGNTFVASLAPGSVADAQASRSGSGTDAKVSWNEPRRPGTGADHRLRRHSALGRDRQGRAREHAEGHQPRGLWSRPRAHVHRPGHGRQRLRRLRDEQGRAGQ
jgi:hypothetical protein